MTMKTPESVGTILGTARDAMFTFASINDLVPGDGTFMFTPELYDQRLDRHIRYGFETKRVERQTVDPVSGTPVAVIQDEFFLDACIRYDVTPTDPKELPMPEIIALEALALHSSFRIIDTRQYTARKHTLAWPLGRTARLRAIPLDDVGEAVASEVWTGPAQIIRPRAALPFRQILHDPTQALSIIREERVVREERARQDVGIVLRGLNSYEWRKRLSPE